MTLSLNDEQIVKVVYQINKFERINFNYENGVLKSITPDFFKDKTEDYRPSKEAMSDREMISVIQSSGLLEGLIQNKNKDVKSNIAREIVDNIKKGYKFGEEKGIYSDKKFEIDNGIEYSDDTLEIAKNIMNLDKDGTLDLIAKKNREKINDNIDAEYDEFIETLKKHEVKE